MRLRTGVAATDEPTPLVIAGSRLGGGTAGLSGRASATAAIGDQLGGLVEVAPPIVEGRRGRELKRGLGVPARGADRRARHQFCVSARGVLWFRNSSTRRRWRASFSNSPRTLLAPRGRGRRPRIGASDEGALRSASISSVACSAGARARRASPRHGVARLLGGLLGSGKDVVQLAAGLARVFGRSAWAGSRSRRDLVGVLEPLLDPRLAVAIRACHGDRT